MREIIIKAYQFNELSPAAQKKAIEWWRDLESRSGDSFWSEFVIEEAVQQGRLMGFSFDERQRKSRSGKPLPGEPCIYWSGFWNQGDGACFEGSWSARDCLANAGKAAAGWGDSESSKELRAIAAALLREAQEFPDASFRVKHRGHYSHEHCTEFSFNFVGYSDDEEQWTPENRAKHEAACDQLIDLSRSFMRWIYRQLESAYEDHLSEANARESILANELEFTEDGERI